MAPIHERPEDERIQVTLPDLFQSFLKAEPVLNPLYEQTRTQSEEIVCRECRVDAPVAKAITKCDFAYFAAVMAPYADEESFRTICDWGNWIFPFDDLFDIGSLRADYEAARKTVDQLLECFLPGEQNDTEPKPAIVSFHHGIWARIQAAASLGVQKRYAGAMSDYCAGTLAQVRQVEVWRAPSVETMLALRRSSVCVSSLFVLIEYAHQNQLPDVIFDSPAIQKLERAGIDLTLMHNDILSYHREETESVPHNLVAVARMQGMSAQAAFDHLARLINARHVELAEAVNELPSWGERVDGEVERYVRAVKDVVKANLWWSFRSARFLSEELKVRVRTDWTLDVLARPSFLEVDRVDEVLAAAYQSVGDTIRANKSSDGVDAGSGKEVIGQGQV